jgi:hypothetical protein
LRGRDDAQLFALDANQPDGADADLLIDSLASVMRMLRMAVG